MSQQDIEKFVLALEKVERSENMGYIFFFYGSNHMIPFATIGYADNPGDTVSNLNREGIFRVNVGVSKDSFEKLFPNYSEVEAYDYKALDTFMPHPHYAKQFYICILNPSLKNDEKLKSYINEAHLIFKQRFDQAI